MSEIVEQPVVIMSNTKEGASTKGILYLTKYSGSDRLKRALIALFVLWSFALVFVFIPIAHFFLVPGAVIAGPIVAFKFYRNMASAIEVKGDCPKCLNSVVLRVEPKDRPPVWLYCPQCEDSLRVLDSAQEAGS